MEEDLVSNQTPSHTEYISVLPVHSSDTLQLASAPYLPSCYYPPDPTIQQQPIYYLQPYYVCNYQPDPTQPSFIPSSQTFHPPNNSVLNNYTNNSNNTNNFTNYSNNNYSNNYGNNSTFYKDESNIYNEVVWNQNNYYIQTLPPQPPFQPAPIPTPDTTLQNTKPSRLSTYVNINRQKGKRGEGGRVDEFEALVGVASGLVGAEVTPEPTTTCETPLTLSSNPISIPTTSTKSNFIKQDISTNKDKNKEISDGFKTNSNLKSSPNKSISKSPNIKKTIQALPIYKPPPFPTPQNRLFTQPFHRFPPPNWPHPHAPHPFPNPYNHHFHHQNYPYRFPPFSPNSFHHQFIRPINQPLFKPPHRPKSMASRRKQQRRQQQANEAAALELEEISLEREVVRRMVGLHESQGCVGKVEDGEKIVGVGNGEGGEKISGAEKIGDEEKVLSSVKVGGKVDEEKENKNLFNGENLGERITTNSSSNLNLETGKKGVSSGGKKEGEKFGIKESENDDGGGNNNVNKNKGDKNDDGTMINGCLVDGNGGNNEIKCYGENKNSTNDSNKTSNKLSDVNHDIHQIKELEFIETEDPLATEEPPTTTMGEWKEGTPLSQPLPLTPPFDLTPTPDPFIGKLHSTKFREYCRQMLDRDIDQLVLKLLHSLMQPQNMATGKRVVLGLREVSKHLRANKLQCIIISPNLQQAHNKGGCLDDSLRHVIEVCETQGVPFVFALGRRALGRACGKLVSVSVVGVFTLDGVQDTFNELQSLTERAREAYKRVVGRVVARPSDPTTASTNAVTTTSGVMASNAVEANASTTTTTNTTTVTSTTATAASTTTDTGFTMPLKLSDLKKPNYEETPGNFEKLFPHLGHSRTPSACSAISFVSSVLSEPLSEYCAEDLGEEDCDGDGGGGGGSGGDGGGGGDEEGDGLGVEKLKEDVGENGKGDVSLGSKNGFEEDFSDGRNTYRNGGIKENGDGDGDSTNGVNGKRGLGEDEKKDCNGLDGNDGYIGGDCGGIKIGETGGWEDGGCKKDGADGDEEEEDCGDKETVCNDSDDRNEEEEDEDNDENFEIQNNKNYKDDIKDTKNEEDDKNDNNDETNNDNTDDNKTNTDKDDDKVYKEDAISSTDDVEEEGSEQRKRKKVGKFQKLMLISEEEGHVIGAGVGVIEGRGGGKNGNGEGGSGEGLVGKEGENEGKGDAKDVLMEVIDGVGDIDIEDDNGGDVNVGSGGENGGGENGEGDGEMGEEEGPKERVETWVLESRHALQTLGHLS